MTTRLITGNRIPIPDGEDVRIPTHLPWCFGCGQDNQHGLGLSVRREDETGSRYIEGRALFLAMGAEHYRDPVGQLSSKDRAKLNRLRSGSYYP